MPPSGQDDLRGARDYDGFVDYFHRCPRIGMFFDTHLTPQQTAAVSEFMRQSMLAEIDDERGLAYRA
jgi:hypothetical protein